MGMLIVKAAATSCPRGLAPSKWAIVVIPTFDQNDLVRIDPDGGNRTVLVDGPDLSSHTNDVEGGWLSTANVAWSPDGTKILALEGYGVEGSGYAVVEIGSGEVLSLGSAVLCCEPGWSQDSESFYFPSPVFGMIVPGLWQVDAMTGEVVTIIRGMEKVGLPDVTGETMVLVQSARELQDGNLYAFKATGSYEELFVDRETKTGKSLMLTMSRISSDGGITPLRSDSYALGGALWAEDASGAVIVAIAEDGLASGFQPGWGLGGSQG